jgi:hypothetical protein
MKRKYGEGTMGRKKKSPPSKSIRIHEDIYDNAMIVAGFEKKDLTQFISEILRPIMENLLVKHSEKAIKNKGKQPPVEKAP